MKDVIDTRSFAHLITPVAMAGENCRYIIVLLTQHDVSLYGGEAILFFLLDPLHSYYLSTIILCSRKLTFTHILESHFSSLQSPQHSPLFPSHSQDEISRKTGQPFPRRDHACQLLLIFSTAPRILRGQ